MRDAVAAAHQERAEVRGAMVELARTLSISAIAGAVGGLAVGGVLGRLAMRLLAVTSPWYAQGGITDDRAVVGAVTLAGTVNLALVVMVLGVIGGLIYPWVRRVLPDSFRGRVLGYGLFTGTVGGALLVHDHPSFDYTVLAPAWLAVALFVALPLLYGFAVAALVEATDRDGGLGRRVPWWVLVVVALAVGWPSLLVTTLFIGIAIVVVRAPALRQAWRSREVTIAGRMLFVALVLWGVYGIVADVVSIATDQPSPAPFNP